MGEEKSGESQNMKTFHDAVRGLCGALFFALPLHFTMEMWERAKIVSYWDLIIMLVVAYILNLGFGFFSGFKKDDSRKTLFYDAFICCGIGMVGSAITMFVIDQISIDAPISLSLKTIALVSVPTSFGASLAKNSFGKSKKDKSSSQSTISSNWKKVLGSILGATMVAFNIAPTIEPIHIASQTSYPHIICIILLSLITSYAMVFVAGFADDEDERDGFLSSKYTETLVAYVLALSVSAGLLWAFGYLSPDISFCLAASWIVILGYVTTLGAAAGRIIL